MKKVIFILVGLVAVMAVFTARDMLSFQSEALEPLYNSRYIIVYGRDGCSRTQQLLSSLKEENKDYIYKKIDERSVKNEVRPRLKEAGYNTRRIILPVVDVNGKLLVNRELKLSAILEWYETLPTRTN